MVENIEFVKRRPISPKELSQVLSDFLNDKKANGIEVTRRSILDFGSNRVKLSDEKQVNLMLCQAALEEEGAEEGLESDLEETEVTSHIKTTPKKSFPNLEEKKKSPVGNQQLANQQLNVFDSEKRKDREHHTKLESEEIERLNYATENDGVYETKEKKKKKKEALVNEDGIWSKTRRENREKIKQMGS